MKKFLSFDEFDKLAAIVGLICLLILITLYAYFSGTKALIVLAFAIVIVIVCCFITSLFWTSKGRKTLADNRMEILSIKPIALVLSLPVACAVIGILAMIAYANTWIAIIMTLVLSWFLGFSLANIAKNIYSNRKRKKGEIGVKS